MEEFKSTKPSASIKMNLQYFAEEIEEIDDNSKDLIDKTPIDVVQKDQGSTFDMDSVRQAMGLKPKEQVKADVEDVKVDDEVIDDTDEDEESEHHAEASETDKSFLELIKSKAIYNKQPIEYESIDQAITDIQKGKNYDKVKSELEALKDKLKTVESAIGSDIDTALLDFKVNQDQRAIQKLVADKGYTEEDAKVLYEREKEIERLKRESKFREHIESVKEQKAELKGKPYYADVESELDALIEDNAKAGKFIDAETAYKYLVGRDIEKLLERVAKEKEKKVVADMQDKSKRKQIKSEGQNKSNATVTPTISKMAQAMGISPTAIAQRIAKR